MRRLALSCALAGFLSACARPPEPPATPVYHSVSGRYQFAIPAAWVGHYSVDTLAGSDQIAQHSGMRHMVSFTFLGSDTTVHPPLLLSLITFARTDWTQLSGSNDVAGVVVAERPDEVIVAGLPGSNPYDSLSPDGRRFAQLRPTLVLVRAAMTLE